MRDTPMALSTIAASINLAEWPTSTPPADTSQSAAEEPAECGAGEPVPEVEKTRQRRAARTAEASAGDVDPAAGYEKVGPKAEQVRLIRTIGTRMKEAREELAGLSQIQAAELLGYKNPSKLSKIEGASDTFSVPLTTIRRAAEIYDVSVDFLFGLTDDWERDPQIARERAIGRWLFNWLEQARTKDTQAFADLLKRFDAVSAFIPGLAASAEELLTAFHRFRDLNADFENLIGGARLEACIARVEEDGRKARAALRRLNRDLGVERAGAEAESVAN